MRPRSPNIGDQTATPEELEAWRRRQAEEQARERRGGYRPIKTPSKLGRVAIEPITEKPTQDNT